MDANACRQRLAQLLNEELAAFSAIEELLEHEYTVLINKDTAGLELAMNARQERMRTLMRIDDNRRQLCRTRGLTVDGAGMKRLLDWCDPSGSLRGHWKDAAARAARCRTLNDRNGVLVAGRANRAQALLGVLKRHETQAATYSARGGYSAPRSARTLGAA